MEVDLATRRCRPRRATHQLTPTEARLLQVLAASVDRVVPTDELLDRVWTDADGADPSYLWVTVRRLRRKLEADPDRPRYLITERGVGYRLSSGTAAPVAGVDRAPHRALAARLRRPPAGDPAADRAARRRGSAHARASSATANATVVAVVVFLGALGWAAMLALVFTGGLADEVRSFLSLAERGERTATPPTPATPTGRWPSRSTSATASSTPSRARRARVPIDDEPRAVVGALVSAVRTVMRDPTWRCAVMTSATPDLLPPGVYHGIDDELPDEPIGELERWASVTGAERPARHVEGPWGAFAVADVAVSDRLGAILYAPWEGRLDPTPAEIALLTLVGQHAGTALEHSLLYAQVRSRPMS